LTNGIVLYDPRLGGSFVGDSGIETITVSDTTTLATMARRVRSIVAENGGRPVPRLTIMAHSVAMETEPVLGHTPYGDYNFFIQLGTGLHIHNVGHFGRLIRGLISDRIRLLVCQPVRYREGSIICSRLAMSSGIPVYASSSNQDVENHTNLRGLINSNSHMTDFGPWEGHVFRYSPTNGSSQLAFQGPDAVNN
jgi:hypothetical protein